LKALFPNNIKEIQDIVPLWEILDEKKKNEVSAQSFIGLIQVDDSDDQNILMKY